jgi:hypothetical protein
MEPLKKTAGYLLLITLLVSPFLYGGTTTKSSLILSFLLYGTELVWIVYLVLRRRLPHFPKITFFCIAALLLQGWIMAWNARSVFDRDFLSFMELSGGLSFLPGSIDKAGSLRVMTRLGALLLLLVMSGDLAHSTRWLRRLIYTMAFTGAVFALFGIWQKTSANALRIWPVEKPPPTAFATFWYHGNAASLLNMTWPLCFAAALWSFQGERGHVAKAVWIAATGAIFCALAMNVSKAGHLIALGLVLLLVVTLLLRMRTILAEYGWRQVSAFGIIILLVLTVLVVGSDTVEAAGRWTAYLSREGLGDSRIETAQICVGMIPAAGVFGFGPGTFVAAFQQRVAALHVHEDAIWASAHNDWLQYFVEWGVFGGLVWLVLWSVPVISATRHFWVVVKPGFGLEQRRSRRSRERWHRSFEALRMYLCFGASLALIGVLMHAVIDFPLQIMALQIYAFTLAGIVTAEGRKETEEASEDG